MGEARKKIVRLADLVKAEARCIYCNARPRTIEHMPPRSLFGPGERPKGMEFASCFKCNSVTSAADLAASFYSRIAPEHEFDNLELERARELLVTLTNLSPTAVRELFDPTKAKDVWARGRSTLLGPMQRLTLDGPATHALMRAFGTKLAMAGFREFVGTALPLVGRAYSQHYFNSGLDRQHIETTLSILPAFGELSQGRKRSGVRFNFRYNTDKKSIFAGFFALNNNLFFRVFAATDEALFGALDETHKGEFLKPGQLIQLANEWSMRA